MRGETNVLTPFDLPGFKEDDELLRTDYDAWVGPRDKPPPLESRLYNPHIWKNKLSREYHRRAWIREYHWHARRVQEATGGRGPKLRAAMDADADFRKWKDERDGYEQRIMRRR